MSKVVVHYDYVGILTDYFNDIVAPLLCKVSDNVLDQVYGQNKWEYVEQVMQSYPYWDTIQNSYQTNNKLTMDATGILYLMFPYNMDEQLSDVKGLMHAIQSVYGLNEYQTKSVKNVRSIRNDMSHTVKNNTDLDGHLELDAFDKIIKALSLFDVNIKLKTQKYIDELNYKVKNNKTEVKVENSEEIQANNLAIQTRKEREEYSFLNRYSDLEWMNAPIGLRLNEAPWYSDFDDLDSLPWPSKEKKELPPIPEKQEPLFDKDELKDIANEMGKQAMKASKEIGKGISKGFSAFKKYLNDK